MDEELKYASADSRPFSNMGDQSTSSDMWPMCLSGRAMMMKFIEVSTQARALGVEPGTMARIQFAPHNPTYFIQFEVQGGGVVNSYGYYTWSLTENWRGELSGGQNTRQAMLGLGEGVWGRGVPMDLMCIASERNSGTMTCSLGFAHISVV